MKKFNLWLLLSLFVAAFAMSACSSSDDATSGGGGEGGGGDIPVAPTTAALSGVVYSYGSPMSGVKVTVGTASVTTGYNGLFSFDQVSGSVIKFEKEGYATVTRAISDANSGNIEVSMVSVSTTTFSAGTATSINAGYSSMKVDIPASIVKEDGTAYTGTVTAKSAYLDPIDDNFSTMMPGDLSAVRTDQSEASLISYGMVSVELTGANGEKLQPGAPATLTFPVPTGTDPTVHPTIPLWQFNEATGLWEEEGSATYDSGLNAYVGTVTHFSWHNLDWPEVRATLKVKVIDNTGNPIAGTLVDFDGQRTARTNAEGIATCTVPSNTPMTVRIPSKAYGDYAANEYGTVDPDKEIKATGVTLNAQETKEITLSLPKRSPIISGTVTNEGTGSKTCILWIKYNGVATPTVVSDLVGGYKMYAPNSYRGKATIVAMFSDGYSVEKEFTVTDEDQTIDFTANSSSAPADNVIAVTADGLNARYTIPAPDNGTSVYDASMKFSDNYLSAYLHFQSPDGWGGMDIVIEDFDATAQAFTSTKNHFSYSMESRTATSMSWMNLWSSDEGIPIQITNTNGIYTFNISGAAGKLRDMALGFEDEKDVMFTVKFSVRDASEYESVSAAEN